MDQHLAVLADFSEVILSPILEKGQLQEAGIFSPEDDCYFLSAQIPRLRKKLPIGQILSVFPMRGKASGVTLKGFRYLLNGATILFSSQGLSNEVIARRCSVEVKKGCLLIVVPKIH